MKRLRQNGRLRVLLRVSVEILSAELRYGWLTDDSSSESCDTRMVLWFMSSMDKAKPDYHFPGKRSTYGGYGLAETNHKWPLGGVVSDVWLQICNDSNIDSSQSYVFQMVDQSFPLHPYTLYEVWKNSTKPCLESSNLMLKLRANAKAQS